MKDGWKNRGQKISGKEGRQNREKEELDQYSVTVLNIFKYPVKYRYFLQALAYKCDKHACVWSYLNVQVNKHALQTIGYFREGDPSPQLCRKRVQQGRETPVFVLGHNHQHSHNILPPQFNGQREEGEKWIPYWSLWSVFSSNVKKVLTNLWLW